MYIWNVNSVCDIKRFVDQQLIIKQGNIKYLVMILYIGKKRTIRDGEPLVFISDDNKRGCYIVAAFIDLQKNVIYYGDSLGWSSPENLVSWVKEYTKYISNKECTNNFRIINYHKPTEENIYNSCSDLCTGLYPLQSDSHICDMWNRSNSYIRIICMDWKFQANGRIKLSCQSIDL